MTRTREIAEGTEPRVYVASLRDYNEGSHLGRWYELADYDDAADLLAAIHDQLKQYDDLYPDALNGKREEWSCHDYEGFPERLYSEGMSFEPVYAYMEATANMDVDRKAAYEFFIENGDEPEQFEDRYLGYFGGEHGHYDDDRVATDYAEQTWHEAHDESEIPASLRNYVDWAAMGRDLVLSGSIWIRSGHIFQS